MHLLTALWWLAEAVEVFLTTRQGVEMVGILQVPMVHQGRIPTWPGKAARPLREELDTTAAPVVRLVSVVPSATTGAAVVEGTMVEDAGMVPEAVAARATPAALTFPPGRG
jgi:hypothetical protein